MLQHMNETESFSNNSTFSSVLKRVWTNSESTKNYYDNKVNISCTKSRSNYEIVSE